MNTNENSAHSFTEGSDSGTLKFSKPTPNFPKGGEEIKDGEFVSSVKEKTKHTPGPWTYRRTHEMSSDHWYVIVDSNGNGPIVDVGGKDFDGQIAEAKYLVTDPKEIEANAALIASAPDLLIERDYWLEQAKQSNKENQELKARVKDFEFAASVNHDAYNKQKALNAELLEALEKAQRAIQQAATESCREEIQRYLSGGYTEMIQAACFKDSLGIDSAINKAKS